MKSTGIFFVYEKDCGGETVVTENIISELKKLNKQPRPKSPRFSHPSGSTSLFTASLQPRAKSAWFSQSLNKENIKTYSLDPLTKTSFTSYFGWIFKSIFKSIYLIFKIKPKKWVYTTTFTAGVAAILLKAIFKYKIAFHYHGSRIPIQHDPRLYGYHNITQKIKYKVTYLLHKIFIENCDLLIVPSEFTKKDFIKEFPFSKKSIIQIVANGVDLNKFKTLKAKEKSLIKQRLKIPNNSKIILYSGRIDENKKIVEIVKVVNLLKNKGENVTLLIAYPKITRGSEKEYLLKIKNRVKSTNTKNNVILLENYSNISYLYQISDISISLSQKENFPMTMLESFATKTIYAAYPAGEVAKILTRVDSRLLIKSLKPGNIAGQLNNLLTLPDKSKGVIISKEYREAQKYALKNQTKKIIELLA